MTNTSSKDTAIKIEAMSLLWDLEYVVRPEVLLSEPRYKTPARREGYLDLTDIDVLGYSFSPLMQMQTVAIDCGAGKKRSAMERVFWVRGLIESIGLQQAIAVIGHNTEEEHRLAADKMNVVLVSAQEFKNLSASLLGRTKPTNLEPYYTENTKWLQWLALSQTPFAGFIMRDNWTRDWNRIPVAIPVQLKRWGVKIVPDNMNHQFTFLEVALLLSIGLVRMAAYLTLVRPNDFGNSVHDFVLGGGRSAKLFHSLLKKVDQVGGQAGILPGLVEPSGITDTRVPYFDELLDLTDRLVKNAGAARSVPRYLQAFQLARIDGAITNYPNYLGGSPDVLVTKLALDVLKYLRVAGNTTPEVAEIWSHI